MKLIVECKNCKKEVETKDSLVGHEINCSECNQLFDITLSEKVKAKKVLMPGFTKNQRQKRYQNAKEDWENKGCKVVDYFDGGLTKGSYIIVGLDEQEKAIIKKEREKKERKRIIGDFSSKRKTKLDEKAKKICKELEINIQEIEKELVEIEEIKKEQIRKEHQKKERERIFFEFYIKGKVKLDDKTKKLCEELEINIIELEKELLEQKKFEEEKKKIDNEFASDQSSEIPERVNKMCRKLGYKVIKISKSVNITQIKANQNKLTYSERYFSDEINIEKLQNEVVSFLASKQQQNRTEIFRNKNLDQIEIWFGLDASYCVKIKQINSSTTLKFGRISAARTAAVTLLTGGLAAVGGVAIAATRKKFELDFWKFIDGLSWLNSAPVQQVNIPVDIPAQIEKIAKLHENGILTKEEYEKKKKDLLDKM